MKGLWFYAVYHDRCRLLPAGQCIAVNIDAKGKPFRNGDGSLDATVATFAWANSSVCSSGVSTDYLRDCCRRVHANEAVRHHPELLRHLLSTGDEETNQIGRAHV
jgi:hypothetical protein